MPRGALLGNSAGVLGKLVWYRLLRKHRVVHLPKLYSIFTPLFHRT